MDLLTQAQRSETMRRVLSANTKPELAVRSLVHRLGYRYRLHVADLPGKPDLVFPSKRKIILVHGCFWHGHRCRAGRNRPASNVVYWAKKLEGNQIRDRKNLTRLRKLGYRVLIVWECNLERDSFERDLVCFLSDEPSAAMR